jgi:hypothetical protein
VVPQPFFMDDQLAKPFNASTLRAMLERMVTRIPSPADQSSAGLIRRLAMRPTPAPKISFFDPRNFPPYGFCPQTCFSCLAQF